MNLLIRIIFFPLTLGMRLFFFMMGRQADQMGKRIKRADTALEKDDGETLRRLYEKVKADEPSGIFQGTEAVGIAKKYGAWLHRHRRYEDALNVWRFALTAKGAMHTERIDCYFELASCLLALDKPEQVESEALRPLERMLGQAAEQFPASDTAAKIAQFRCQFLKEAKLRRKAFQASPLAPPDLMGAMAQDYDRRFEIALAYYNGGHLRYALKHIDVACTVADTPSERVRAYALEATWLRAYGEFQRAENRIQQAVNEAGGSSQLQVRAETTRAFHLLDLGRLTECELVLGRILEMPEVYPPALNVLADYHTLQGNYDTAREILQKMREIKQSTPWFQRRHFAVCDMALVLVELNAAYFGEPADLPAARQRLEAAQHILHSDAKLRFWITGMDAALLSLEKQAEMAREQIQTVESGFEEFADDPTTQETACSLLLGTYLELGEYELARQWGEKYLEIGKRPVYRVGVQEKLSRVYEALGDETQAQEMRRAVVESGFPVMAVRAKFEK